MLNKAKLKLFRWALFGALFIPGSGRASFEQEYDRCFQYFARLKFDYQEISNSDDFDRYYGDRSKKRRLFIRFCYELIDREPEYKSLLGSMTWTKSTNHFHYGRGRKIFLLKWMLRQIHPHNLLEKKLANTEDEIISSPEFQPPEMLDQLIGPIVR